MQAEILRKTKFVNFSFPLGGGLTRDVHLAVTGVSTTSCTDASAGCSPQYAASKGSETQLVCGAMPCS